MPLPLPHDQADAKQGNGWLTIPKVPKPDKMKIRHKGKGNTDIYALFGDDKSKFAEETLLGDPNASSQMSGAKF